MRAFDPVTRHDGSSELRILLTNDDGYGAEGLETLARICSALGEVFVVAPSHPQSGVGHTVTTDEPLQLHRHAEGRWSVSGTPADCTRVGLTALVHDVDWVVSGINHGANLGCDTYISGTVAAAREAALLGRRAIAISHYRGRYREIDWSVAATRAGSVLRRILDDPADAAGTRDASVFWNVNLPHPDHDEAECELVECGMDPSPHAFRYERDGAGGLRWQSDFHERPRLPGHDIDVCLGGRIAVTRIPLRLRP